MEVGKLPIVGEAVRFADRNVRAVGGVMLRTISGAVTGAVNGSLEAALNSRPDQLQERADFAKIAERVGEWQVKHLSAAQESVFSVDSQGIVEAVNVVEGHRDDKQVHKVISIAEGIQMMGVPEEERQHARAKAQGYLEHYRRFEHSQRKREKFAVELCCALIVGEMCVEELNFDVFRDSVGADDVNPDDKVRQEETARLRENAKNVLIEAYRKDLEALVKQPPKEDSLPLISEDMVTTIFSHRPADIVTAG